MNLDAQILFKNVLEHIQSNELDRAQKLLTCANESTPDDPDVLRFLSVVAALQSDHIAALNLINQAIALAPNNGVAHSNKGNILKNLGRYAEALCSFDEAIKLLPNYAEPYNNKGNVLQDLRRYEESLVWYDKAIALQPDYVDAYGNKGNALEWLRRPDEAICNYDKATAIDPGHIDSYWHKAMSQLAGGHFELGWQNYEARWSKSNPVLFQYPDIPRLEEINHISGKRVLVWAEQGLGDTLQFCRYIKPLALHGAVVTFRVPSQLLAIMDPVRDLCILKTSSDALEAEFDFQTPLMSLPLLLGTTLDTVPKEIPYLDFDSKKKTAVEADLLQSPNLKVGIVWSGGFRLPNTDACSDFQRRNMELEQMAGLKEVEGVDFYSLQKGDPAESELPLKKDQVWPDLVSLGHLLGDFSDTAALMASLDLIISVDTSTAHLAGALGKPVWILNRYESCWRWLRGHTDSPWYPSATIYQQSTPGDWSGVIDRVKVDLAYLVQSHAHNRRDTPLTT
jgi:tetratricopeptide (TPR) repeat protein